MSFAMVIQGMTLITYLIILAGGKQKRETGWKILTLFLMMIGLVQCAAMAMVVSFGLLQLGCATYADDRSPIYTITTTTFTQAGSWMTRGSCALLASACP